MYTIKSRSNTSDYLNFENLLRSYTLNPNNLEIKKEIQKIIKSALAFQNGEFIANDYIDSSEAYNLFLTAVNLDVPKMDALESDILSNDSMEIIKFLLENISNPNYESKNSVMNSYLNWR